MVAARRKTKKHGRYRSGLEKAFAGILEANKVSYKYETTTLIYTQPAVDRRYLVDFDVGDLRIETKGRLTAADRKKMKLVKEQQPDINLVMVFDRASKKINKGSPTSYGDWCDKNGIKWLEIQDVKEDIKCLLNMMKSEKGGVLSTLVKKKKTP